MSDLGVIVRCSVTKRQTLDEMAERSREWKKRVYRLSILRGEQRRGTHVLLECKAASYTSRLSLRARRSQKVTRDCATCESISFGGTSESDPNSYRILLLAQRIKFWPGATSVRHWMTLTFRFSGEEVVEGLDVGQGSWRSVKIRERIPLRRDGSNWTYNCTLLSTSSP